MFGFHLKVQKKNTQKRKKKVNQEIFLDVDLHLFKKISSVILRKAKIM